MNAQLKQLHGYEKEGADLKTLTVVSGKGGTGKTTIINLLPRFYDPTEGKITVDGHDLPFTNKDQGVAFTLPGIAEHTVIVMEPEGAE